MNVYSNRKSGATYVYLVTTAPPPLSLVFHRGEWTLGVVLDIYGKFSEAVDYYYGCILAGLN